MGDRFERLLIAKITQCALAVQTMLLLILTLTGVITIWILLALVLYGGVAQAFFHPIRQAMVPSLVARPDIPAAVALSATFWHASGFVGPAIAGILIVSGGVPAAFGFNMLTFVILLWALWQLDLPPQPLAERSEKGMRGDIAVGFRYVADHVGIGPMLMIVLFSHLFARFLPELLPGFAEAVFERGAVGLAWMTSAAGLGAMLSGLWIAQRGKVEGLTMVAVMSLLGMGLSMFAFTAAGNFWIAIACLVFLGFALTANATSVQTLIQSATDRAMLGRVMGLFTLLTRSGVAFGALIIGALSEVFGLRPPVATSAVVCVIAWTWAVRRRRTMAPALETDR